MSSGFSGGCHCGAVRYECAADPFMVAYCHCRDCQYAAGGGASTVIIAPRAGVTVSQGETTDYSVVSESGSAVTRRFCGTCGRAKPNPGRDRSVQHNEHPRQGQPRRP